MLVGNLYYLLLL